MDARTRIFNGFSALALALLVGCPSAAPVDTAPPAPQLPDGADHARLATFVAELAADDMQGRLTGAPSGEAAEAYVLAKMQATGLAITSQTVPFPLSEIGAPIDLALVDGAGVATPFAYIDDYREVDFGGAGDHTAELVFAGYGLDTSKRNDFDGLDVAGKIIAVLTGVPSGQGLNEESDGRPDHKLHYASEHGAVGVIFIPVGALATQLRQSGPEAELCACDGSWRVHPALLHDDLAAVFVQSSVAQRLLGHTVTELLADPTPYSTGQQVHLEVHNTNRFDATCQNVLAVLPASQASAVANEVVVLGAHYDHLGVGGDGRVFNGASDNATGAAVVLEAATRLAESGMTPKRTIVFAMWCGEEQGLYGSRYYVDHEPLFPLSDTVLMMQVDYLGEQDGPYVTNLDDGELVASFLGSEAENPAGVIPGIDWGGGCASDDCPFLWESIPAYRFVSYGANHHRSTDVFENLDMAIVERVADVTVMGLERVAW